jgi:pathogenesis-related protein 1
MRVGYKSIGGVMRAWADDESDRWHGDWCSGECGHYTQVMWRKTKKVGCGSAKSNCNNNEIFFACQYIRPGNCGTYDWRTDDSPCPSYDDDDL